MATLYCIVWIAIILAFSVYCIVGRIAWRKRKDLPGFLNPLNEESLKNMVTTEIEIISRPRQNSSPLSIRPHEGITINEQVEDFDRYTVEVEAGQREAGRVPSVPANITKIKTITRNAALQETNAEAWLYARTSFLFFLALLITWVSPLQHQIHQI